MTDFVVIVIAALYGIVAGCVAYLGFTLLGGGS